MYVIKFGGTSLSKSENFEKIKKIISNNPERQIVVVSAPGKRDKNDIKITENLIDIYHKRESDKEYLSIFNKVKERYLNIVKELNLTIDLEPEFDLFLQQIKNGSSLDFIASRGEYFSAKIMAKFLNFNFVDAKDIIEFKKRGEVDLIATQNYFNNIFNQTKKIVVPGFYGADKNENILTFSRGGSDVTGAILAYCANAKIYENWTDIDGFCKVDPRICKNPKFIKSLTYRELRELSYMGATVLHADCAFFANKKNIPINIKNTFNPESEGTFILKNKKYGKIEDITGIAGQKGFSVVHIEKYNLNNYVGIFEEVSKIFRDNNISIEHIPTGIDGLSIVFKNVIDEKTLKSVLLKIKKVIKPDKISTFNNVALICVVLGNVKPIKALSSIFTTLNANNIDILTVSKDSSSVSISFGIAEKDYELATEVLAKTFNLLN